MADLEHIETMRVPVTTTYQGARSASETRGSSLLRRCPDAPRSAGSLPRRKRSRHVTISAHRNPASSRAIAVATIDAAFPL